MTALRVYVEQRQCSALETLVQCFLRAMEKWCVTRGAELPRALPCRAASPVTMSTKTCRPPKFKHTLEEVVTSQRRATHSPSTLFQSLSLSQHRLGMLLQNLPVLVFPSPVCVQFWTVTCPQSQLYPLPSKPFIYLHLCWPFYGLMFAKKCYVKWHIHSSISEARNTGGIFISHVNMYLVGRICVERSEGNSADKNLINTIC